MSSFQIQLSHGLQEFRELAPDWNDLWLRSFTRSPTVRAEAIEHWVQMFSDPRNLTVVSIIAAKRLVAAIPLIRSRLGGVCTFHHLPVNCWSHNGDLLLDQQSASTSVGESLIDGIRSAGITTLLLDDVAIHSPQWKLFRSLSDSNRCRHWLTGTRPVGVVDTLGNWPAYEASWASKFRSSLKRNIKQTNKLGQVEIKRYHNPSAVEIGQLMRDAFEIEDKSWKGENGSSILRTPGMPQYMVREAELMMKAGVLDLWFLMVDGHSVAFEYCHLSKSTCFCHKIGFDSDHRSKGIGKVLRYHQLQFYNESSDCREFDTLGLFCPLKAKWSTRTYQVGRIYASLGNPLSKAILDSAFLMKPAISKFRRGAPPVVLEPGARRYLDAIKVRDTGIPIQSEDQLETISQGVEI